MDVMVLIFGIGSSISVKGLWVELPLIVQTLPESLNLPSFLSIIIQVGNFGLIVYALLHAVFPKVVNVKSAVYVVMTIGTVSSLLMIFLWQETTFIAGQEHSTALMALLFFVSLVDCSSSVLFMPFIGRFYRLTFIFIVN